MNNSYVGEFGNSTAMGDALGLAINSLNEFNKSRVIILLTDGANSSGEFLPETIAYIAKEKNIPIYTIGIGKEDKVPLLISNNRITYEFLPLDEKSLKQIAEISNGKYFKVTDINDLKKVYSEISKLTKVKLKSYDNVEIKYHHKELLIIAFMMLIIGHILKLIFVVEYVFENLLNIINFNFPSALLGLFLIPIFIYICHLNLDSPKHKP